jgi:uncharacterized protein (DUF433 family)
MATLVLKINLPDEVRDQLNALPAPLRAKINDAARERGLDGLGFFIQMKTMLLLPKSSITLDPIEQDILNEVWLTLKAFDEGVLGQNGKRLDELAGLQADQEENKVVTVDEESIARLANSRIKVSQIAMEHTRLGLTPEQIAEAHPHLSQHQVYAALAFYYGHKDAMDAQIAASLTFADQERLEAGPSPLAARLRSEGRLPAGRAA